MAQQAVLDLYVAWYCPFAQRAWIAVEELEIPYVLKEYDPYDKSDNNPLKKVNPRVLVPAILHGDRNIYESLVCVEYLDEEFGGKYNKQRLYPQDNFEKAHVRICLDLIGTTVVPAFYKVLATSTASAEGEAMKEKYLQAFREMDNWIGQFHQRRQQKNEPISDFFTGGDFGALDIALAPWAIREYIVEHYRGISIPNTTEYSRYKAWAQAVRARESVQKTMCEEKRLLDMYVKYTSS